MKHATFTILILTLAACAPTTTILQPGVPWNDVAPAAKHHGYTVGDTSGLALSTTLLDEPPGILIELADDSALLLFSDRSRSIVESMAIYSGLDKAKGEREWKSVTSYDLESGSHSAK